MRVFSNASGKRVFQKNYLEIGARNLVRMVLVLARVWGGQSVGISPTEMAAAEGKKESVSPSLFVVVNDLEVEEDLPPWLRSFGQRAFRKQIFEVQARRYVCEGLQGASCAKLEIFA